jgi:hypothetical protein
MCGRYVVTSPLLAPHLAEEMEAFEVGLAVNSPAVDRPDLVIPTGPVQ